MSIREWHANGCLKNLAETKIGGYKINCVGWLCKYLCASTYLSE